MTAAITHIFFDLHGTLIDGKRLHPCYTLSLGRVLAARYGLTPEAWIAANRCITDDWDSYYADLDLSSDDGLAHLYEGMFRVTRALFRLAGAPEPPKDELIRLSRTLPGLITAHCDGLYPDARHAIASLHAAGYTLGVATHALHDHARGLLAGAGVLACFSGPLVGADTAGQYEKDHTYFLKAVSLAGVSADCCLVVDDVAAHVNAAQQAGMRGAQVVRKPGVQRCRHADHLLDGGLSGLAAALRR